MFQGLCFIRTSRPENNIIYNCNEDFHVGQAKASSIIFATPRTSSCITIALCSLSTHLIEEKQALARRLTGFLFGRPVVHLNGSLEADVFHHVSPMFHNPGMESLKPWDICCDP